MSNPISDNMRDKLKEDSGSDDWVHVKENGKIVKTKDNPFVGRLLKHEYVDADNPQYGNDEGKKHILTWLTRENGEQVKKKQSTTSDWFMTKLIDVNEEHDTWDFKWWYEQQGKRKTVPFVEPYEKEMEEETTSDEGSPHDFEAGKDPNETEEVDIDDIPF